MPNEREDFGDELIVFTETRHCVSDKLALLRRERRVGIDRLVIVIAASPILDASFAFAEKRATP